MKKVILSSALIAWSLIGFAQSSTKNQTLLKEDSVKYIPASDKRFAIEFSSTEFNFFLSCAQFGFQPYVKTTTTPINQVETLQQSYTQVLKEKIEQFRKQYFADSLQHAKH